MFVSEKKKNCHRTPFCQDLLFLRTGFKIGTEQKEILSWLLSRSRTYRFHSHDFELRAVDCIILVANTQKGSF